MEAICRSVRGVYINVSVRGLYMNVLVRGLYINVSIRGLYINVSVSNHCFQLKKTYSEICLDENTSFIATGYKTLFVFCF